MPAMPVVRTGSTLSDSRAHDGRELDGPRTAGGTRRRLILRGIAITLATAGILALIGAGTQAWLESVDRANYPPRAR